MVNLTHMIRNLKYRVSLTPKMLGLTVLIGLVVWGIMDHILTKNLKEISDVQLAQILSEHFQEDRIRFDNYVNTFQYALTLIIYQKNFYDYVAEKSLFRNRKSGLKHYSEIPPWLPDASVMRHFIHIHYALLLDRKGIVREVYQGLPGPLPPSLSQPSDRIMQLSRHESFLTSIDGMPYLLTSGSVRNPRGEPIATLMIAAHLDDGFLIASQGLAAGQKIVGLLSGSESRIIASNRPDILVVGTTLDTLKKRYLVVGKSFFDMGSSELTLEFASLLSRAEFEKMNKNILAKERLLRAALSLLFILSFAFIMVCITRQIQRLTETITDISRETLHIQAPEVQKGDQIHILANQFQYFAKEIIESREQLKKQAEELLREKTVYLDNILHSSSLAIMAMDSDFRIKYYNTMAEKYFGYEAKEVVGKTVMELDIGKKRSFPLFEKAVENAREDGSPPFIDTVDTADGICFLESKVAGIFDKENKLIGFMLISRDVTERKRAEATLQKYSDELVRSNKELELFASIASHDLQEPLRVVTGFAQLLDRRYRDKLDAEASEFISFIVDGAGRMHQLIKDLLDYSRVTTRGKPLEAVDANGVVSRALSNLKMSVDECGAEITVDALPEVNADESQLVRLFQNLIGNAVKYRGEAAPRIRVSAKKEGNTWVFSVADNGIGIDPQYHERIFQIFQRLHDKDEYPGTGIGLAVCKRIVERHGGRIWVESAQGKGSVFYFTIPENITGELK